VDPAPSGTFGDELRRLRCNRGLSLRDFAKQAHHSKTVVWEWETGAKMPTADDASSLDTFLGSTGTLVALQAARLRQTPSFSYSMSRKSSPNSSLRSTRASSCTPSTEARTGSQSSILRNQARV
jgi:transcriptional regulator with XRE-family HTH domain